MWRKGTPVQCWWEGSGAATKENSMVIPQKIKNRIIAWSGSPSSMYPKKMKTVSQTSAAAKSLQSCPTLCDPINGRPPGSPVPGILQSRTLEWVAMPFSRGSSWPRDWTCVCCVSCIGRRVLYHEKHLSNLPMALPLLPILFQRCFIFKWFSVCIFNSLCNL